MQIRSNHCRTYRGNVIIMSRSVQKRSTVYSIKGENWKLASESVLVGNNPNSLPGDIGGSFALYVGFTFISIVETTAFFFSRKLRRVIAKDDQTLIERKNPPIKFPCRSRRIINQVSVIQQRIKKTRS